MREKGLKKREEILEFSQRFFLEKGYLHASINDLLSALNLSKGGFYHYFESKEELLKEICTRFAETVFAHVKARVEKEEGAPEKLNAFFLHACLLLDKDTALSELLIRSFLRKDDPILKNALLERADRLLLPLLEEIIAKGIEDADFYTPYTQGTAQILLLLLHDFLDKVADFLVSEDAPGMDMKKILLSLQVWRHACEKLLDAPFGSVVLLDLAQLQTACENIYTHLMQETGAPRLLI